nr:rna binding protein musashi [Hymenolepis microstoma]
MALDAQGNEVGKLFVGGLHQSTNTSGLHNYFSKFGDIEESIVMMDNKTGRSRGFGYVKFKEPSAVDQVLSKKVHVIDNKEVDPKRCNINMRGKNKRSLKIFVGGIAFEHDEEIIRSFFQCYGNVTDVNLLSNPGRPRHRGFAFVGFDDEEVVKRLIKLHFVNLHGKQVEIKPMEPPNAQKNFNYNFNPGALNTPNCRPPVRGTQRFNSFHQNNMSYGRLNHWSSNGDNGRLDMAGDANGWASQVLAAQQQQQGLNPAWNSPPNQHQWNDPTPSSPLNGSWENQLAAAAAAAFQSNGFISPSNQQSWGQPASQRRGPSSSLFRGDNGNILDGTLLDYNSWNPPNGLQQAPQQQQQNAGIPSPPNHFFQSQPSAGSNISDPFSRRGGEEAAFVNAWSPVGTESVNQWNVSSMNQQPTMWNTSNAMRDQNETNNAVRLANTTIGALNPTHDSSAFRMDSCLYRAVGGGNGNGGTSTNAINGISTSSSVGGILIPNDATAVNTAPPFTMSEAGTGTEWQSIMAVAAAQQRSTIAGTQQQQHMRR